MSSSPDVCLSSDGTVVGRRDYHFLPRLKQLKSLQDLPAAPNLDFAQIAFNCCAGHAAIIGKRLTRKLTLSAFAMAYAIYKRTHPDLPPRLWAYEGCADTMQERNLLECSRFARMSFNHMCRSMVRMKSLFPSQKRLTSFQWKLSMQDAFDIFTRNPNALQLQEDQIRSDRNKRDRQYAHVDEVLEKAAQNASLIEWNDRRTNYGRGR
jgi:hypothetical protein